MSESSPLLLHQNTSLLPGIPAATVETTNNDTRNVKKAKLGTFEGVFLHHAQCAFHLDVLEIWLYHWPDGYFGHYFTSSDVLCH